MNWYKIPMMLGLTVTLSFASPVAWAQTESGGDEKGSDAGSSDDSSSLDKPVVAGVDKLDGDGQQTEPVEKIQQEGNGPKGSDVVVDKQYQLHTPLRFYSSSPAGEAGLLRVHEAFAGPPMSIRLSLHGSYFTSGSFLNYLDLSSYTEERMQGQLGISFTPLEYLEIFLGLHSSSNYNSAARPQLLQTQGDLTLGAKGIYPVLPYLGLGLDAAVTFSSGIGELSPSFGGTNFQTSLLLSFDARGLSPEVPLRAHLNAGFILDNTGSLSENRDLSWVEQYALGVNSYNRVALGFGIDAPLGYLAPVAISPFVEYTIQIPVGVTDDDLANSSLGSDATLIDVVPMVLTPGVRVTYLTDVTFDLAVDIGLGGEKAYLDGIPSTAPWTLWFGLTYAFNPMGSGPVAPERSIIEGTVKNSDGVPIGGAVITFGGVSTLPVASTESSGKYFSEHDHVGSVMVTCSKEGFMPETHEVSITRGKKTILDFSLMPEEKKKQQPVVTTGKVVGRVVNAADQMPLAFAVISFDLEGLTPVASDELEGKYISYQLQPGTISVTASKEGFKPVTQKVEIKTGETSILDFALESDLKMGTLSGTVMNEKDKPMVAKVSIDGPKKVQLSTSADTGAFSAQVPVGSYVIKVTADGYMAKARRFELKKNQSVMAEFKLSPRPKRKVVILKKKKIAVRKKIHFASGKTDLRADANQILDGVVEVLVNHPEITKLRIEGHTDSMGSARLNKKLSQGRAESVVNYLVEQGIDASRLEAKGYGESKPIAPNNTRRGREQNRRVEFTILSGAK